jgi:hypothetical protein
MSTARWCPMSGGMATGQRLFCLSRQPITASPRWAAAPTVSFHGMHVVKSVELTGAPVCPTPSIWSANADLMVGSLTVLTHVQYGCTAVQICEGGI